MTKTKVMFSYGSNLNIDNMMYRCPQAEKLGRLRLRDWQLVFRGVADIVPMPGAICWGGVWRITPACERALDRYEGVDGGMYRKEYLPIKRTPHGETDMLIYVMNSTGVYPPSERYLQTIIEGYRDFGLPKSASDLLDRALWESWAEKAPTAAERQRTRRTGRPKLAALPCLEAWDDTIKPRRSLLP